MHISLSIYIYIYIYIYMYIHRSGALWKPGTREGGRSGGGQGRAELFLLVIFGVSSLIVACLCSCGWLCFVVYVILCWSR